MSKEWYNKHHLSKETPEFVEWFLSYYGPPELYGIDQGEQDEYWVRRGFAMAGWTARSRQ